VDRLWRPRELLSCEREPIPLRVGTTAWFRFRTLSEGVYGHPSRMVSFVVH
jgi:hypothetical protein